MDLLFCLDRILTDFRDLFNTQNFALFRAFIIGLIVNNSRGTVTQIYQASPRSKRYWSFVKFLSRGKWDADAVAIRLIKWIVNHFPNWVYVYDDTQAIKTGKTQWGVHFFRNFRYQKRNVNQSKFHLGHQFGALGVLCATATQTLLLPVWVKWVNPKTIRYKSDAVLGRICSKIPKGLIIFDRGFSRRKVFTTVMRCGHQILCRAKSNAVFYRLPKVSKRKGRGRPKQYGDRLDFRRLRYKAIQLNGKMHSVTSKVARTKMCDAPIRLVVIRTRPKVSKPYRYFCVFTTDLTLEISQIIVYYRQRWQIETAFRDAKQHFGFDSYQVKSKQSINRFVQLSFVAASVTKLIFLTAESDAKGVSVETVCERLGIHWYHPVRLTQGLRVAYLRVQLMTNLFSASLKEVPNSQKITPVFEQDTPLPIDKAA